GAALATRRIMSEVGPQDVVLITRQTMYTFALEANTAVRLRPTPDEVIGYMPLFADKRLHPLGMLTPHTQREIGSALETTNRAYVVDSDLGQKAFKNYRAELTKFIASRGFKLHKQTRVGTATIAVWQREGKQPPSR